MISMKYFGRFLVLVVSFSLFSGIFTLKAQGNYGDFTYDKNAIRERKVIAYPPLREADVMFMWRVYRVIDTREKMNVIMKWPRNPLYKIIYDAVTLGYGSAPIPAYRDDSLIGVYTAEEVFGRGGTVEVIEYAPDPNYPDDLIDSTIVNPFRPSDIVRYRILEDWIFDKQRSMFFPRIIAIAPLFQYIRAGVDLGEQELFWVKWEDFQKILVNQEIFNRHNDALRLSYLDFFELRYFTSYVTRESNAFDYAIKDFEEFKEPMNALLESERIKERLFDWEHDLWEW